MYTDGEAIILNEVMTPDVLDAFAKHKQSQGKGAPSLSRLHQDLDNTTEFRDCKAGLRTVAKWRVDVSNPTLQRKLKMYFNNLDAKFSGSKPSSNLERKLTQALLQLVTVMQSGYHTVDKMKKGWVRTGNHLPGSDPANGDITVDYATIMSKSRANVTDEQLDHMLAKKPQVIAEFMRAGRVTDAFLDGLGIVKDFHGKSRDDLVLCRQDAQLLTHAATVERIEAQKKQRELEDSPAYKDFTKRLSAAEKDIARKAKALVKSVDAAKKKEETKAAKDAEKARWATLTKAQQAAEKAQQKAQKSAEKAEKDAKAQRDFETSLELVGPARLLEKWGLTTLTAILGERGAAAFRRDNADVVAAHLAAVAAPNQGGGADDAAMEENSENEGDADDADDADDDDEDEV